MAVANLPVDQRVIDIDSRRFASIEKALVELITNDDDSYSRLESVHTPIDPVIRIYYERHKINSILAVSDCAEGMSLPNLRRILSYGGSHSLLAHGQAIGRGYFGRGLKQAVYGLGYGWIESIANGRFSRIDLFRLENGRYVYDDGSGERSASAEDYRRLQIPAGGNGTTVTIVITNPQVSLPFSQSLAEAITNNIYLRDIQRRRRLEFSSKQTSDARKAPVILAYQEPDSIVLLGPDSMETFRYQEQLYPFWLTLKKSVQEKLILKGDERSSGLLILSGTAVLDCQFFQFENQLGTEYLFGHVSCPALLDMLGAGQAIISDEREGLNTKHPFVQKFAAAVSELIRPAIERERLRLSHIDHASTSRRTKTMIETILKKMNQAAAEDLGISLPPCLRFSMPVYYRQLHHHFHITLHADVLHLQREKGGIQLTYDLPPEISLAPQPETIEFSDLDAKGSFKWLAQGHMLNINGHITATAGNYSADCKIAIVKNSGGAGFHHPHDKKAKSTYDESINPPLFAGYELRSLGNDIDRAIYAPAERLILINTEAPTVRLYVNGQGHFRDDARLLLAELFLDVIAGELARRQLMAQGTTAGETLQQVKQSFIHRYGLDIHRILLGE